jgi:hypothetical protein
MEVDGQCWIPQKKLASLELIRQEMRAVGFEIMVKAKKSGAMPPALRL